MDIQLHGYQSTARDFILRTPYCGVFFDMGLGKAIDDDAFVMTPDGRKRVGDVVPGDTLLDVNGASTDVTAVFHHTSKPAYEIKLNDGRTFTACEDHRIPLMTPDGQARLASEQSFAEILPEDLTVKSVKEILDERPVLSNGRRQTLSKMKLAIPRAGRVQYPKRAHPIPPDVMGLILRHAEFTDAGLVFRVAGFDTTHYLHELGDKINTDFRPDGTGTYYIASDMSKLKEIERSLTGMGYAHGRQFDFIPDQYLFDSVENRILFVRGFLDAPDNAKPKFRARDYVCDVPEMPSSLIAGFRDILISLGFGAKIKYSMRGKMASLDCRVATPVRSGNYSLQARHVHTKYLYITSITPVRPRDMTCFTVTAPTHTYLLDNYIPTHNTLLTLDATIKRNPRGHVLVVAPKNIARNTWIDEIRKFDMPIRYRSLIANDSFKDLSKAKRLERYEEAYSAPPTMYFINRELLLDLINHMPMHNGRPVWYFPNLILDESQSFKSYKSERFKAIKRVMPAVSTLIELSGTPTPHGLMDLWSQIYLLDGGARLGPNITWYRNTFFRETKRMNGYPVAWEPLPGAEDEIYRRISDITISAKNDSIKLPPVTYNNFKVYLSDKEMATYRTLARTQVLELSKDTKVLAVNAGVLYGRLAQLASGTIYTDEDHNYQVIHARKIEALNSLIQNSSGPVMIAYYYQSDKQEILKALPQAELFDGSHEMLSRWNRREIPIMMLHPASAGHGLNFQAGGHTLIWYSIQANLEQYLQTNARLYRQGQSEPVIIHHIIAEGTVDNRTMNILGKREADQDEMLDAIKLILDDLEIS